MEIHIFCIYTILILIASKIITILLFNTVYWIEFVHDFSMFTMVTPVTIPVHFSFAAIDFYNSQVITTKEGSKKGHGAYVT